MKNLINIIFGVIVIIFIAVLILFKQDLVRVQDSILQVLLVIVLYLDYRQTLDIKNHDSLHEINLIMGEHPTDNVIGTYFVFCIIAACMFAYVLPNNYRIWFQLFIIIGELVVIYKNKQLGLKIG